MTQALALIIDDEADIRELLDITLSRMGLQTKCAANLNEAFGLLKQFEFNLCLSDMRLPDGDGIEIVQYISENHSQTPVAMITAHGNMDTAILALKAGAFDFVSKPVDLPVLRKLVETALRLRADEENISETSNKPSEQDPSKHMLGNSQAMRQVRKIAAKVARSQAPIFISGESGTGKELAARMIHEQGPRHDKPFIGINCGAIPAELMESEFFGHKKGSFTGATTDKPGLFQAAEGGTLFLDEVADLPLNMQVKMLRAIQEKQVRPIGANQEVAVDIRIISATHKDMGKLLSEGDFRQDLYFRLHVIELTMPPLRERPDDIPELAEFMLDKIAENNGIDKPLLSKSAHKKLLTHLYPGNVRELENILERASAMCEDNIINDDDLGIFEQQQAETVPDDFYNGNLPEHLEDVEKRIIVRALKETRWNRTAAAKKLGISFRALRYRLEKLGLATDKDGD